MDSLSLREWSGQIGNLILIERISTHGQKESSMNATKDKHSSV
jgi:hypothetical protein